LIHQQNIVRPFNFDKPTRISRKREEKKGRRRKKRPLEPTTTSPPTRRINRKLVTCCFQHYYKYRCLATRKNHTLLERDGLPPPISSQITLSIYLGPHNCFSFDFDRLTPNCFKSTNFYFILQNRASIKHWKFP
jgi:hypothetical protein